MGFDDGQILLDSDNGAYYAGQTVYGRIVFDQGKPKTIHGIYVSFKGFCKVHWTSTETHKENERDVTETINHDSYEEYFNRKIYLMGGPSDNYQLHPGHHEFNFDFPLPINIPSSFEAEKGHIRYRVKAVMDTSGIFSSNKEKMVSLRVFTPVDLNQNPFCKEPIDIEMINSYCCWCVAAGSSEVRVKMPVGGYCPGQTIPVEVNVSNLSRVDIDELKFTITRFIRFEATDKPDVRTDEYTVAYIVKGPAKAGTTPSWNLEIPIQAMDVYNFDACRFIGVNYIFRVSLDVSGCHENDEHKNHIVFGTVPLVGYQDNVQNPETDQMPKNIPGPNVPSPVFYPAQVIVNQPGPTTVSQNQIYPQNNPYTYPGTQPYPNQGNQPYNQGNQPYPYPGNQPYHNAGNQHYHNPGSQTFPNPGNQPSSSPGNQAFPNPGNQAYPNPVNQPFPNPGNQPFPNVSPYPNANQGSPYQGSLGFVVPPAGDGANLPLIPPGVNPPYPKTGPSAPQM